MDHNYLEFLPSGELLSKLSYLHKLTAAQNDIAECPPLLLETLPRLRFIDVKNKIIK
jgi:hypothetical protein